jgi:hypothetical protein
MGKLYQILFSPDNAPAQDSVHLYQCDLDSSSGTWTFSLDGAAFNTYQDDAWKAVTASDVQWNGEIYNQEDDMPGTQTDKCNFTGCQYRTSGNAYQDAGLVAGDVTSDDPIRWRAEWVGGTAFNIWDVNP